VAADAWKNKAPNREIFGANGLSRSGPVSVNNLTQNSG